MSQLKFKFKLDGWHWTFCGTTRGNVGDFPIWLNWETRYVTTSSSAGAYLAPIPQRGKLCISWLLPPLPSLSPLLPSPTSSFSSSSTGKSPSSSCERWPSLSWAAQLGLDPSWWVGFQLYCMVWFRCNGSVWYDSNGMIATVLRSLGWWKSARRKNRTHWVQLPKNVTALYC